MNHFANSSAASAGFTHSMHATTVLCVRDGEAVAMGSDGQVTLGNTVVKSTAKKVRKLANNTVLAGFAGATADAFTLLERFEKRLAACNHQLAKAADGLARDWRTDRVLRRLEAMLLVADKEETLLLSGMGDVIAPEHNVAAIGSGAPFAEAAALAMLRHGKPSLGVRDITQESLNIAGDICIYTNRTISIEELNPAAAKNSKTK